MTDEEVSRIDEFKKILTNNIKTIVDIKLTDKEWSNHLETVKQCL